MSKATKVLKIPSWEHSVTGQWSPDTGIYYLRDYSPEELVDLLWEWGSYVQNGGIIEMMGHGYPRKAAEFARALVAAHPIAEESIRAQFGTEGGDYLLIKPLEEIPSSPSDYPPHVTIEYIQ